MKKLIPIIIVVLIAGGGGFYAGIKYAQNNPPSAGQNFSNLSPEERQQRMAQMGGSAAGLRTNRTNGQAGAGFVNGEIIAKDNQSITVKLRDNGSKIIFFSDATQIGKFTEGTPNDLEIGKIVTINGTANQDGSITAQTAQIMP